MGFMTLQAKVGTATSCINPRGCERKLKPKASVSNNNAGAHQSTWRCRSRDSASHWCFSDTWVASKLIAGSFKWQPEAIPLLEWSATVSIPHTWVLGRHTLVLVASPLGNFLGGSFLDKCIFILTLLTLARLDLDGDVLVLPVQLRQ